MYIVFVIYLIILSAIDARKREFSMFFCIAGFLLAVICLWSRPDKEWLSILFGLIPGAMLLIVAVLTEEKIGIGDAVVALLIGLAYPFEKVFVVIMVAFLGAFLVSLVLVVLKKAGRKTQMAFVPFLTMGVLCAMIGDKVLYV